MVLGLLAAIRTEEARALRWDHVVTWMDDSAGWQPVTVAGFDPGRAGEDGFAIYAWRSDREGDDTKTRSRGGPWRCRGATTESVYRHEIRLALTQGAEVMDKIFG